MDNLPSTAMGAARLLPTTQTQIDAFSDQLIRSVKDGECNPIEVLIILKAFAKASERTLKEIQENFVTEAAKYPEKTFDFNGVKITKSEVGTKYNYSICGDLIYNDRLKISNEAEKQLKEREEFLKALREPITVVDEGSGEVIKIIPPSKTSTTSLTVSIR